MNVGKIEQLTSVGAAHEPAALFIPNEVPALKARIAELEKVIRQFAECNLNDGNCASLELATTRIRNLAKSVL